MKLKNINRYNLLDVIFIMLLGVIYRVVLLLIFPALYGGDSVGRLFYRDSIFFYHWLPLTQSVIVLTFKLTKSVFAVRIAIAVAGALAAWGFYAFLRLLAPKRVAFIGGIIFTLCPLYIYLSLVPYQEVIFLGLFYGGLAFLFKRGEASGSNWGYLLYGLACLTRYEAWFLLPILFLVNIKRVWKSKEGIYLLIAMLQLLFALGWGPMLWMILNEIHWGSFTAFLFHREGSAYVGQPHLDILGSFTYLGRMVFWIFKYGSPLVLLALPGFYAYRKNTKKFPLLLQLAMFLGLLVLIFLTFFVGPEFSHIHRFAAIPLSVVLIFTAFGMEYVMQRINQRWQIGGMQGGISKLAIGFTISIVAILMLYSAIPIARANQMPESAVTYKIAKFLDNHLQPNEKAVVVAEGFQEHPEVAPMPYQRIGAQSNLGSQQILSSGLIDLKGRMTLQQFAKEQNIKYVVICSNFEPWLHSDQFFIEITKSTRAVPLKIFPDSTIIYLIKGWNLNYQYGSPN